MRTTMKELESLVQHINRLTNSPLTYCDQVGKSPFKANIGHYYIERAYGGNKLVRVDTEGGGVREVTYGFVSKQELASKLHAFIAGVQAVRGEQLL